jgi:hypothetical protein
VASCDNVGRNRDFILERVATSRVDPRTTIPELMDEEDKAALDVWPDRLTIYRGCGPNNKDGFSWSLNRKAAQSFPFRRLRDLKLIVALVELL